MSLLKACCLLVLLTFFTNIIAASQNTSSPGCSKSGGDSTPGTSTETIRDRSYLLSIPLEYSPDTPAPLILSFHGGGQTSSIQLDADQLTNENVNDKYIVVYPEAVDVCLHAGKVQSHVDKITFRHNGRSALTAPQTISDSYQISWTK